MGSVLFPQFGDNVLDLFYVAGRLGDGFCSFPGGGIEVFVKELFVLFAVLKCRIDRLPLYIVDDVGVVERLGNEIVPALIEL